LHIFSPLDVFALLHLFYTVVGYNKLPYAHPQDGYCTVLIDLQFSVEICLLFTQNVN